MKEHRLMVYSDGKIERRLYATNLGVRTVVMTTILDTRDEQIKQALIALGWTPPPPKQG